MKESSLCAPFSKLTLNSCSVDIETELVSEEEMAAIEAALAAATATPPSSAATTPATPSPSQFRRKARSSIHSITSPPSKAKRRLSFCAESDIEDLGSLRSAQKKIRVAESFFQRFRSKTGLYVSDVTSTEWCEKQEEFVLLFQERETDAMRTGRARHAILEDEVVKKVEIQVRSAEDKWAVRLMNFVIRANQLLFGGLTRELPLIGFVEGIWMVGMIDEVRMALTETDRNAILVETKTRQSDTPPAEPQQRNGRLQLMCYKYLWDNLVADNFSSTQLFNFFSLNPYYILSEEIWKNNTKSGFPAKTLDEVVRHFRHACRMLPPAHDQLLLRYEFQKDNRVLGEDHCPYDSDWVKSEIHRCLELWVGGREGHCTPERWKCRFCKFAKFCPSQTKPPSSTETNPKSTPG